MGCNCKKAIQIEDRYGTKMEENLLQKTRRNLIKILVLLIGFGLGIVIVPVVTVVLIYNQIFRGGKGLTMPKMLSKYLR